MNPGAAPLYIPDDMNTNHQFGSDERARPASGEQRFDLHGDSFIDDGILVSTSEQHGSVLPPIKAVRLRSSPSKIFQGVIFCIAIIVTAEHPWRTRANERLQNEALNISATNRIAAFQGNARRYHLSVFDYLPSDQLVHWPIGCAMIAAAISVADATPTRENAPVSCGKVSDVSRDCSHGHLLAFQVKREGQ